MRRAVSTSLFALMLFLSMPVETFADHRHDSEVTERVQQMLRSGESLKISDWLRLSRSEEEDLIQVKLRLRNQHHHLSTVSLVERGNILETAEVRSQYSEELSFRVSSHRELETLRLICHGEVLVESISAVFRSQGGGRSSDYGRGFTRQAEPEEIVQLHLNKVVRGGTRFQLTEMAEAMQALTLEGAEIERVILIGRSESRSRTSASAQVLIDGRPVSSHELISTYSDKTPIRLFSRQFVQRSLELVVQGEMVVDAILIKVGKVQRTRNEYDSTVQVRQLLQGGETLELAPFISRYHESQTRLTILVNSLERYGELQVWGQWGFKISSTTLREGLNRVEVIIPSNIDLRDVALRSWSRVVIEAIEFEGNSYRTHRRN